MNQECLKDKELEWLLECEERVYKIISTDIEEAKYDNEDYVNSYVDRKISLKEEIEDLKMQVSEYKHQKIPNVKEDLRVAKADLSLEQKRLETLNKENEEYLAKVLKLEEQERNLEEHCRILDKNCKPNEKDLRLIASAKQKLRLYRAITGIKWDLSAPDNIVKGYITNKINNYVEPFCFDKNKDLVPKCLWNLLKQATKEDPNVSMEKDRCE